MCVNVFLRDRRCRGHSGVGDRSGKEGKGSVFRAGRPPGPRPRRCAVGTVGRTWRYKSNSPRPEARVPGQQGSWSLLEALRGDHWLTLASRWSLLTVWQGDHVLGKGWGAVLCMVRCLTEPGVTHIHPPQRDHPNCLQMLSNVP